MRRIIRRVYLLVLASALVGAAFGSFHRSTVFADGFDYMCDASQESCDDGSGSGGGGSSTPGGGGGGAYTCPTVAGCGNWGCYANSQGVQTCALYNLEGSTHCTGTRTCTRP
jgi:hypothetical protein